MVATPAGGGVTGDPRDTEWLVWPESCTVEVSRRGFLEACGKLAVAVAFDPNDGYPMPVCAHHSRGQRNGMMSLFEVIQQSRATAYRWAGGPYGTPPAEA